MPKPLKLILLMMALAFVVLAVSIEYARRHPITDAEIQALHEK